MKKTWLVVASGVALVAGFASVNAAGAHTRSGKATLSGPDGTEIGTVKITTERGHTEVKVRLQGAPGADAFHGFHIHANDVPGNGEGCLADPAALSSTWFVSADGHYNPTGKTHAHHVGDMPVVYVNADGSVETVFQIDPIKPSDLDGKVGHAPRRRRQLRQRPARWRSDTSTRPTPPRPLQRQAGPAMPVTGSPAV